MIVRIRALGEPQIFAQVGDEATQIFRGPVLTKLLIYIVEHASPQGLVLRNQEDFLPKNMLERDFPNFTPQLKVLNEQIQLETGDNLGGEGILLPFNVGFILNPACIYMCDTLIFEQLWNAAYESQTDLTLWQETVSMYTGLYQANSRENYDPRHIKERRDLLHLMNEQAKQMVAQLEKAATAPSQI